MDRGRILLYPGIIMMFTAGLLYFILHGVVAQDFAGIVCFISVVFIIIGASRKSMKLVNIAIAINLITFVNDIVLVLTNIFPAIVVTSDRGQTTLGIAILVIDVVLFLFITFMLLSIPFRDNSTVVRRKSISLILFLLGIRITIFLITSIYTKLDFLLLLLAFLDFLLLALAVIGAILCIAAFPYDKKKKLETARNAEASSRDAILKMLEFWKVNYREMTKAEMVREKICTIEKCGAMIRMLHEAVMLPEPVPRDIIKVAQDAIKTIETPNLLGVLHALNQSVHFSKQVGKYLVDNKFIESFPYYNAEETAQASVSTEPEPPAIEPQSIHEDQGTEGTSLNPAVNSEPDVAVQIDSGTSPVKNEQISMENNNTLTGAVYICPECGQKYRLSQAIELAQKDVCCFTCNTPIVLD